MIENRASGRRPGVRLDAVARYVPPGSRVADIGTGHGLLARALVESGTAAFCVAADRDRRGIAGLRGALSGLGDRLEPRCADGLDALRPADRIDVVTICGLGARAMIRILQGVQRAVPELARLVLQPQTEPARLRRWLRASRLRIVAEEWVVERKRHYVVIVAEPARGRAEPPPPPPLSVDDLLEVGPCLAHAGDSRVLSYWTTRFRMLSEVVARTGDPGAARRRNLARRVLLALDRGPGPSDILRDSEERLDRQASASCPPRGDRRR